MSNTLSSEAPARDPVRAPHIPALDGKRGLAILSVMVLHFTRNPPRPGDPAIDAVVHASRLGRIGVDLFFVLSGFLITGALLDGRDSEHRWRSFFVRRAFRIVPLYYAYLFVWLYLVPRVAPSWFPDGTFDARRSMIASLVLYLSNVKLTLAGSFHAFPAHIGHFWSLAIEEQFYLVWPFVVWAINPRRLRQLCVALLGVALATRLGALHHGYPFGAYALMLARVDTLALGALLAVQVRRPEGLTPWRRWIAPLSLGGAALFLVVAAVRGQGYWTGVSSDSYVVAVGYTPLAVAMAGFVAWAGWLGRGMLPRFGHYAYGLYVLHPAVADALIPFASRRQLYVPGSRASC